MIQRLLCWGMEETRLERRARERRQLKTEITTSTESGVPNSEGVMVAPEVITPEYKIRRFGCNGVQYNNINKGMVPDNMPQDLIDAIRFTADLRMQGGDVFRDAEDRAYLNSFGRTLIRDVP